MQACCLLKSRLLLAVPRYSAYCCSSLTLNSFLLSSDIIWIRSVSPLNRRAHSPGADPPVASGAAAMSIRRRLIGSWQPSHACAFPCTGRLVSTRSSTTQEEGTHLIRSRTYSSTLCCSALGLPSTPIWREGYTLKD